MIIREVIPPRGSHSQKPTCTLFSFSGFQKMVQTMRAEIGLPSTFTLALLWQIVTDDKCDGIHKSVFQ